MLRLRRYASLKCVIVEGNCLIDDQDMVQGLFRQLILGLRKLGERVLS
jgi:hypothetical protein